MYATHIENFIKVGISRNYDQGDHGLISNSNDHEQGNHCSDYCTGSGDVTNIPRYKEFSSRELKGSVRGMVVVS